MRFSSLLFALALSVCLLAGLILGAELGAQKVEIVRSKRGAYGCKDLEFEFDDDDDDEDNQNQQDTTSQPIDPKIMQLVFGDSQISGDSTWFEPRANRTT